MRQSLSVFIVTIASVFLSAYAQSNFDPTCPLYSFLPNKDPGNVQATDPNAARDAPVPADSLCACANICNSNIANCDFAVHHAAPTNDCVVYRVDRSAANVVTVFRDAETVLINGDIVGYQFNPPATADEGLRLNLVECVNQCNSGPSCDFFNYVIEPGTARTALNTTVGQCWIKSVPTVDGASLIFRNPEWGPGGVPIFASTTAPGDESATASESHSTSSETVSSTRTQPPVASTRPDDGPSIGVVAGGVVGGCAIIGVLVAVFLVIFFRRRAAEREIPRFQPAKQEDTGGHSSTTFSQQPLSPLSPDVYNSPPETTQLSAPVSTQVAVTKYNEYKTVNRGSDMSSSQQQIPLSSSGYLLPAITPMASSTYQNLPRRVSSKKSTEDPDYAVRDSLYTVSNRDSTFTGITYYTQQQTQQQVQSPQQQGVPYSPQALQSPYYVQPVVTPVPLNQIEWQTYMPAVGPNGEPKYYMCVSKYEPTHDDEIEVDVRDIVQMQQVFEDGWCRVLNLNKNRVGIMPCLFLLDDSNRPVEVQLVG